MPGTTDGRLATVATRHLLRTARLRARARDVRTELQVRLASEAYRTQLAAAKSGTDAAVAVYFADGRNCVYQLEQWLPVVERLAASHPVVLIVRDWGVMRDLQERTALPVVCVRNGVDLAALYDACNLKVCLYVNNSFRNFQSLSHSRMLHVHINHGESDKLSSFSNQVKAYDRVLVAGPVALQRYRSALIGFDHTKVLAVGRPQLDLQFGPELPASPRRTVLYAPTWEGDIAANNWTSLDVLGPQIVAGLLDVPDVRVVYKPHPRVADSANPGIADAHKRVLSLIRSANTRDPDADHVARVHGNVLAMFDRCDAFVGDVSSATLDFLYLRPDAPLLLTDRRGDRPSLLAATALAQAVPIVDSATVAGISGTLAAAFADDVHRAGRGRARATYFGDLGPGQSTEAFTRTIGELIGERDAMVTGSRPTAVGE